LILIREESSGSRINLPDNFLKQASTCSSDPIVKMFSPFNLSQAKKNIHNAFYEKCKITRDLPILVDH